MFQLYKKGFSLVELLVVMSIIGLLTTIATVSVSSARSKARDTKRLGDIKQIAHALEGFYADKGGYPIVSGPRSLGEGAYKTICSDDSAVDAAFPATCSGMIYMGAIPVYPTPGPSNSVACGTSPGAIVHYCYNSYDPNGAILTTWSFSRKTAYSYQLLYGLEASNAALGGPNCVTTPSGTSCS
jgi:prepilin-type N-terminal cleavage/methylation domain-containing protein